MTHRDGVDVFTLEEFEYLVKGGGVTPDDGVGYYGTFAEEFEEHPVFYGQRPKEATHVWWYNN